MKTLNITLSVTTESEAEAVEISERLTRTAIGFGLAGHTATISISSWEDEGNDES